MKRLIAKFKRSAHAGSWQGSECIARPATLDAAVTRTADESTAQQPPPQSTNAKSECNAALEHLPPEVRRHLLSLLDLPRLKALVRASPTFHQQYLFDRKYLLCRSLEETLGSVVIDAYAVHLYKSQSSDKRQFLEQHATRASRRSLTLMGSLTQDEASSMVVFHTNYVTPIMEHFAGWMLDNLAKHTQNDQHETTPSSTETMRLTRAVYRFQLLCQLADPATEPMRFSRGRAIHGFFDILEPWEIEELFAFYQFAQHIYDKVLTEVSWDLHPDNPQFDNQCRPPTPEGAFDLDNSMERDMYLEGTTLCGLTLLQTVLFRIVDHQHLVRLMQESMIRSYIPFNTSEGVLGETLQASRRRYHPSERNRMEEQRTPLPFRGDGEADAPPLAWTIMWGDTYSNLYGCYVGDDMRCWGYIFWDASTLEITGGIEVLKAQWEECWHGYDPRDELV